MNKFVRYGNLRSEPELLNSEEIGVMETYTALVEIEEGVVRSYIKDVSLKGLVNELLGSCLGLSFGLPMAKPIIIKYDNDLFKPQNKIQVGNEFITFGSVACDNPPLSMILPTGASSPTSIFNIMKKWGKFHRTIAFDELIAMTDRHERNILFEDGDITLIDHADAFSGEYWNESSLIVEKNFGNYLLQGIIGNKKKEIKTLNAEAKNLQTLFSSIDCINLYEECLLYKVNDHNDCQAFETFISYRGANLVSLIEKAMGA